jgi:hypothetical protein
MARPQVNGEVHSSPPSSVFIQHLMSYPIIEFTLEKLRSNEYAQKSMQLGDSAYKIVAAPVLPYLAKPYGYVSPYVSKADSLGANTLDRIDERFPVVKKPAGDLYNDTRSLLMLPYHKGIEGRDHVLSVFDAECKKSEQKGLVPQSKAAVTTVLVVGNETLSWLSSFMAAKKDQASHATNEKINQ